MKIRFTRLNLRKDPKFDPECLLGERASEPYIVEFKRHWYSRWKYLIDLETGCPRLFFGDYDIEEVKDYIRSTNCKIALG